MYAYDVHDRLARTTRRIATYDPPSRYEPVDGPLLSADGRVVAFVTERALVADDGNGAIDVYVYETATGTIQLGSRTDAGDVSAEGSYFPAVSADGRYLAFVTAPISGTITGARRIHVRDRLIGGVRSIDAGIDLYFNGNYGSQNLGIDRVGRFVTWENEYARGGRQIFRWDRNLDAAVEVLPETIGDLTPREARHPRMSGDGRRIFFVTDALDADAGSTWVATFADGATAPFARINFQPAGSATPAGYVADTGLVFGSRGNGLTYGWSSANASGRDRDDARSPDQRHDTLVHMRVPTWEIAVPNGIYDVQVTSGDPSFIDSVVDILVEGAPIVVGRPTAARRWFSGHRRITVGDGRISLRAGPTAANVKLCFVDIHRVSGVATAFAAKVNFQPASTTVPIGYVPDSGAVFGPRVNGFTYGWNRSNPTTRDRGIEMDERYDTLIHTQRAENPDAVWEIAVPNAPYEVRVVMGDPAFADSTHDVLVEGARAFTSPWVGVGGWLDDTVDIEVRDGRVTLRNGPDARNAKLSFIDLVAVPTGPG
ncbi:MAG TPA: hypothetical protein VEL07_02005 [Planctomycetota bacterium]|nr:hypothetical protein [Planctomycetota bacterium]